MNNNVTIKVNQALLSYLKGSEVEATIDSVKDLKLTDNEPVSVALESGEHSVKIFFKYLGANCGFATAKFAIGGNDVAVIEYNPPEILAMGGSISVSIRTVEAPKPKPAEAKPAAPKRPAASSQGKTAEPNNTNKSQPKPASTQKPAAPKPVNNNTNTAEKPQNNAATVNKPAVQGNTVRTQPSNTAQQSNYGNTNTGYTNYNTGNYSNNYVKPVRNKFIAILLAVFLGGFGIHKFYTGKIVWGIIYLCLCWTGVPAYVALVEAIIYLFTSNQTFNDKFCS